jgi:hypothetical protein
MAWQISGTLGGFGGTAAIAWHFCQLHACGCPASITANLRFYEKFGREIASAFGYNFPDEAYSFSTDQVKQLVGKS